MSALKLLSYCTNYPVLHKANRLHFCQVFLCLLLLKVRRKKLGGKNDSGKKAWWKKSLVERKPGVFCKTWKKAWCFFFSVHIKIHDEVELKH